jgi:uncharacterized protein (TIGR00255 family)
MVHSMTAFARVERAGSQGTLVWELRSVNHRYLEPHLRLPEALRDLEGAVREGLRQGCRGARWNAPCASTKTAPASRCRSTASAAQLVAAAGRRQPDQAAGAAEPAGSAGLARRAGGRRSDPQALNAEAMALFDEALAELKAGRQREGAELARLINERLDNMASEVATLRALVPQMLAAQRQKILDRFGDMKAELDPQRLEQEMVLLAQKSDVAEELDRLSTHVTEVRRVLKSGGAAGRRLDFLMQELNREANTLGSKAFHAARRRRST